jgi:hypothetical protein
VGDVFLSYSGADKEYAERFIAALAARGISVWWDQARRGDVTTWSEDIGGQLDAAGRVIALVTPNVIASQRPHVLAEMDIAYTQRKLIPIQIGVFRLPLNFLSLMIELNRRSFDDFDQLLTTEALDDICCALGEADRVAAGASSVPRALGAGMTVERVSLAIAMAVFEEMSLTTITEAAAKLEARFKEQQGDSEVQKPDLFRLRSARLREIGAITYPLMHPRLGVALERARFAEAGTGFALFEYIWDEFDGLRDCVLAWLDELAGSSGPDVRAAVGLMIGAMARTRFASILEHVIAPWMMADTRATREVADLALRVALDAPGIGTAVQVQVQDWGRASTLPQIRAAIELACGYTGSRMPNLAISTLKIVAGSRAAGLDTLEVMREAIAFLADSNRNAADGSLFDLAQLVHDLCEWTGEDTPRKDDKRLPLFLFLELMRQLPIRAPKAVPGVLSLQAIAANPEMARPVARMFDRALRDSSVVGFTARDHARQILKQLGKRAGELAKRGHLPDDPVLALAREIYAISVSERDRDRIAFAMRRYYSREQLENQSAAPLIEDVHWSGGVIDLEEGEQ